MLVGRLGVRRVFTPQGKCRRVPKPLCRRRFPKPVSSLVFLSLLDSCASSLRRGHANLLCIVPVLTDDPRRESTTLHYTKLYYTTISYYVIVYYSLVLHYIYIYIHTHIRILYIYIYMYIYIYRERERRIHTYVCVYIYIYIHTHYMGAFPRRESYLV